MADHSRMNALKDISMHPFDKKRWVASTPEGKNFLVSEKTFLLITILNNSSSTEEACEKFNMKSNHDLSIALFSQIAFGLVEKFDSGRGQKKETYLSLKIELLNATVISRIAQTIAYAFRPINFTMVALICLSIVVYSLTAAPPHYRDATVMGPDIALPSLLVWLSLFVHELGHIAACRCFGIKHGGVGVGFYFIIPVVYADITQIWTGSKVCRIITNLAGVFMEIVYAAVLCVVSLYSGNLVFISAASIICLKALLELNPFVRFDGYWLLCDITDTPNLMSRATLQLKSVFQWPPKLHRSTASLLIFFYGVINYAFVAVYIGYILSAHFTSVVKFPQQLFLLMRKALHGELQYADLKQEMLLVILFYILIYNTLKRIIRSRIKKHMSPGKLLE